MKPRGLFIGLSIALAAVTVCSILFTPAESRLRAIPAHAQIVYNNKNPDWFLSFFQPLEEKLPTFGKGDDFTTRPEGSRVAESAVLQRGWFQRLENYPMTIAAVPFGGRERRDTWAVVSELGAPAAVALRWRMTLFAPEGISPARSYAVWPVWKVEHPSLPSWMRVRFAITEGLLICSISSDSHDIYRLLDTADGRTASRAP